MEQGLVLVAKLAGELPYHLPGFRQSCVIDAGLSSPLSGLSKPEVMTMSNQIAHAVAY
jgi:hypothetical protein